MRTTILLSVLTIFVSVATTTVHSQGDAVTTTVQGGAKTTTVDPMATLLAQMERLQAERDAAARALKAQQTAMANQQALFRYYLEQQQKKKAAEEEAARARKSTTTSTAAPQKSDTNNEIEASNPFATFFGTGTNDGRDTGESQGAGAESTTTVPPSTFISEIPIECFLDPECMAMRAAGLPKTIAGGGSLDSILETLGMPTPEKIMNDTETLVSDIVSLELGSVSRTIGSMISDGGKAAGDPVAQDIGRTIGQVGGVIDAVLDLGRAIPGVGEGLAIAEKEGKKAVAKIGKVFGKAKKDMNKGKSKVDKDLAKAAPIVSGIITGVGSIMQGIFGRNGNSPFSFFGR